MPSTVYYLSLSVNPNHKQTAIDCMKNRSILFVAMILAIAVQPAQAQQERSEAAKSAFKHSHPCPSNGHTSGACPGYVIDHIKPLACSGPDDSANMQWQTVAAGKAKDKWERKGCSTDSRRFSSQIKPSISHAPESSGGYYLGPKGGCFTYSARGKKIYVEHSYCG